MQTDRSPARALILFVDKHCSICSEFVSPGTIRCAKCEALYKCAFCQGPCHPESFMDSEGEFICDYCLEPSFMYFEFTEPCVSDELE